MNNQNVQNIPPAEIIRDGLRYEGIAHDYTILKAKSSLEKIVNALVFITFCLTGIIFALIVYPVFIIGFTLVIVLRVIITVYTKIVHFNQKIKILSGKESFWVTGQDTHIFVQVIQGECDIKKVQKHFKALLSKESVLKEIIFKKYGYLCSVAVDNVDIQDHVKYYNLKSQNFPIKEEEIIYDLENDLITKKGLTSGDSTYAQRPNWDVLFIPKFVAANYKSDVHQFALVFRIGNSCSGLSNSIAYLCHHLSDNFKSEPSSSDSNRVSYTSTQNISSAIRQILVYFGAIVFAPVFFLLAVIIRVREIKTHKPAPDADAESNSSNIKHHFSTSKQFNTKALQTLKEGTHTSLKAVVVSSIGTSLRNLLMGLNYQCPYQVCCTYHYNNVSNSTEKYQEQDKLTKFKLGIGLDRPMNRILYAFSKTNDEKNILVASEELANHFILTVIGCLPADIITNIRKTFLHANVNIEHYNGPKEPYKIFGSDITDIYGWCVNINHFSPIFTDLRTLVISYRGKVRACYTGAAEKFNSSNLRTLAFEFEDEVLKIAELCGVNRKTLY